MAEQKREAENARKWSWYTFVYTLAKGDILKIEQILKMNFVLTLNHKAYEQENKNIKEFYEFRKYNIDPSVTTK